VTLKDLCSAAEKLRETSVWVLPIEHASGYRGSGCEVTRKRDPSSLNKAH